MANEEVTRRGFLDLLRTGAIVSAVGAAGISAAACAPEKPKAEQSPATEEPTGGGTTKVETGPAKPIMFEGNPRDTEYYKNLSEADKDFFKSVWKENITPETLTVPLEERMRMSRITTGIYAELTNAPLGTGGVEASYEDVVENPQLAVDSINTRLDLVYKLQQAGARANQYYEEAETPDNEQTQNALRAAQHITAGLVSIWNAKSEGKVESATIVQFGQKLNENIIDAYNAVIDPEASFEEYIVPKVFDGDLSDDAGYYNFYTQDDQELNLRSGSLETNELHYNVLDMGGEPFHDRFDYKNFTLSNIREGSDETGVWVISDVLEKVSNNKPA